MKTKTVIYLTRRKPKLEFLSVQKAYRHFKGEKYKDKKGEKETRIMKERGKREDAMAAAYLVQNVASMVYKKERLIICTFENLV